MLHLVGLPHTRLDGGFDTCAYTQKIVKFRRMNLHRDLTVYGVGGANVDLLDENERLALFGPDDPAVPPRWPTDEQWALFNSRAVEAIRERAQPGDLLLLAGGWSQHAVVEALPHLIACEPGVGYEGILPESFCAFESHAWRHHVYGLKQIRDGRWMDTVIPNYFDPADFPPVEDPDGNYLLFVGRVVHRKGVEVAAAVARATGMRLLVAGPGGRIEDGRLYGDHMEIDAERIDYLGPVGPAERAELMGNAAALLAPTLYVEPFGGVAVEAQMCGTPVVAADFGAFTETVEPGVSGYRFSLIAEGIEAVSRCGQLDRGVIRERAIARYGLAAVAPIFDRWFDQLVHVHDHGWYAA